MWNYFLHPPPLSPSLSPPLSPSPSPSLYLSLSHFILSVVAISSSTNDKADLATTLLVCNAKFTFQLSSTFDA